MAAFEFVLGKRNDMTTTPLASNLGLHSSPVPSRLERILGQDGRSWGAAMLFAAGGRSCPPRHIDEQRLAVGTGKTKRCVHALGKAGHPSSGFRTKLL